MATIRPATEQDIERICLLYTEFHIFHVLGVPDRLRLPDKPDDEDTETKLRETISKIIGGENSMIFVACDNEIVVGLAEVYLKQDEENPLAVSYRYGYLQSLIVSSDYRGSGLGRYLMETAQQWAKERGATEMRLDVWEFQESALPFYEKMGYRTLKRDMVISLIS